MSNKYLNLDIQKFSGGSYDYLYIKEPTELPQYVHHLENMRDDLIRYGYKDVALDLEQFIFMTNRYINQATVFMNNTEKLLKAIEWRESGDYGDECLKECIDEYKNT